MLPIDSLPEMCEEDGNRSQDAHERFGYIRHYEWIRDVPYPRLAGLNLLEK